MDPHWIKNIWGIQQFTTTILGIWFCLKIGYPQIHHCHQSLYTCIDKTYTWVALADLKCSALFSCLSIKQPSIHSWKKTCYCLRLSILWPFFAAQMAGDRTGLFWRLIAWVIMIHIITIAVHYSLIILIITRELSWVLFFFTILIFIIILVIISLKNPGLLLTGLLLKVAILSQRLST